jgi:hypothetical protein
VVIKRFKLQRCNYQLCCICNFMWLLTSREASKRITNRVSACLDLAGGVLLAWPEKPAQPVATSPRDHVHMEMSHTLADGVVDRDERSARPHRLLDGGGESLHAFEERTDVGAIEIRQRDDMLHRNDQRVAREERRTVEEGDGDTVAQHLACRLTLLDDVAEHANG